MGQNSSYLADLDGKTDKVVVPTARKHKIAPLKTPNLRSRRPRHHLMGTEQQQKLSPKLSTTARSKVPRPGGDGHPVEPDSPHDTASALAVCLPAAAAKDEQDDATQEGAAARAVVVAASAAAETAAAAAVVTPDQNPVVAVIGVGFVGRYLVERFSTRYAVVGYDISEERIEALRGEMTTTMETNNNNSVPAVTLTSDAADLATATHFLISVPTLLKEEDRTIDTSYLEKSIAQVERVARPGATVVVESSVAVGMTRSLLGPVASRRRLFAGMSPERVDPGRTDPPMHAIPKIVSGLDDVTPGSLASVARLYGTVFDTIVPVSRPEAAEMAKLYENSQRMVAIAFANEMADACAGLGVDPFEVAAAAATKPFGYLPVVPSVGVGGYCIPINPYFLCAATAAGRSVHGTSTGTAAGAATRMITKTPGKPGKDKPDDDNGSTVVTVEKEEKDIFPLLMACTEKMRLRPAAIAQRIVASLISPSKNMVSSTNNASRKYKDKDTYKNRNRDRDADAEADDFSSSDETLSNADSGISIVPRVLVVGLGFKRGESTLSNSPGLALAAALRDSGRVEALWADPLVIDSGAVPGLQRLPDADWRSREVLLSFDVIVVAVRQVGLDFGMLEGLEGVRIENWA